MARKYQDHTLQTKRLHREEETQSASCPMILKAILSNHLSLPK